MVWSKGKLGSAYYDTETSQLYLQMDVVETNDFQFLKRGTVPPETIDPFAAVLPRPNCRSTRQSRLGNDAACLYEIVQFQKISYTTIIS